MHVITISDRTDDRFPFGQLLWEDPQVVYHGTWSSYAQQIETTGFIASELPFDHQHVTTVARARAAVGILDSFAQVFFANAPGQPRSELSMTGSFWSARAYATDGGGEVVRMMIQEARDLESLCTTDEKRLALRSRWQRGLREVPNHQPTIKAVQLLDDEQALDALCQQVRVARESIEAVTKGGFPIVYALRVEPKWFGEIWERYAYHRGEGRNGAVELRCCRSLITVDRILTKAAFPNGVADPEFSPDGFKTWDELQAKLPEWTAWRCCLRGEIEKVKPDR